MAAFLVPVSAVKAASRRGAEKNKTWSMEHQPEVGGIPDEDPESIRLPCSVTRLFVHCSKKSYLVYFTNQVVRILKAPEYYPLRQVRNVMVYLHSPTDNVKQDALFERSDPIAWKNIFVSA